MYCVRAKPLCGYARVHYTPGCPAWGVLTGLYPTSHYNCTTGQYHDISLATVQYHVYIHTGSALIYVVGRIQIRNIHDIV